MREFISCQVTRFRRFFSEERGVETLEYIGMAAVVVALVGAVLITMGGGGGARIGTAVSQVMGEWAISFESGGAASSASLRVTVPDHGPTAAKFTSYGEGTGILDTVKPSTGIWTLVQSVHNRIVRPAYAAENPYDRPDLRGQCTWYARERHKDWTALTGKAYEWPKQAEDAGYLIGKEPLVENAIVVFAPEEQGADRHYGHVGVVDEILYQDGDGTWWFTIKEANWTDCPLGVCDETRKVHTGKEVTFIYGPEGNGVGPAAPSSQTSETLPREPSVLERAWQRISSFVQQVFSYLSR